MRIIIISLIFCILIFISNLNLSGQIRTIEIKNLRKHVRIDIPYAPYTHPEFNVLKYSLFSTDSLTIPLTFRNQSFDITIYLPSYLDSFFVPNELRVYGADMASIGKLNNCHDFYYPEFTIHSNYYNRPRGCIMPLLKIENKKTKNIFYFYNNLVYNTEYPVPFGKYLEINQSYLKNCIGVSNEILDDYLECSEFFLNHAEYAFQYFVHARYDSPWYKEFSNVNVSKRHVESADSSGLYFIRLDSSWAGSPFDDIVKVYAYSNIFDFKVILDSFYISSALLARLQFDFREDTFYLNKVFYTLSSTGSQYGNAKLAQIEGNPESCQLNQFRINGFPACIPEYPQSFRTVHVQRTHRYDGYSGYEYNLIKYPNKSHFILEISTSSFEPDRVLNGLYSGISEIFNYTSDTLLLYDHYFVRDSLGYWSFMDTSYYPFCHSILRYFPIVNEWRGDLVYRYYDEPNYLDSLIVRGNETYLSLINWYKMNKGISFESIGYSEFNRYKPGTIPFTLNSEILNFQSKVRETNKKIVFSDDYLRKYCNQVVPFFISYLYANFNLEPYPFYFAWNEFNGSILLHFYLLQKVIQKMDSSILNPLGVRSCADLAYYCYQDRIQYWKPVGKYKLAPLECKPIVENYAFIRPDDFIIDKLMMKEHLAKIPELLKWISLNYPDYKTFLDEFLPLVQSQYTLLPNNVKDLENLLSFRCRDPIR